MINLDQHPVNIALKAIAPILGFNYNVVSARDEHKAVMKYPSLEYVPVSETSNVYDASTNSWRTSFLIQLDLLVREVKPYDFCKYDELKDCQDIQSLHYFFSSKIRQLITLLVNPKGYNNDLGLNDMIYSEYRFKLEQYIQTIYRRRHGENKETGISAIFTLSARNKAGALCCPIDDVDAMKEIVLPDTTTYKKLERL